MQLTTQIEARIDSDAERLQATLEEQRSLTAKLRDDLARSAQEVATAAAADLEAHGIERRKALQELADRLRLRERELQEQIDREQAEAIQRVAAQLGDVEHRQLEQLRRIVSREATATRRRPRSSSTRRSARRARRLRAGSAASSTLRSSGSRARPRACSPSGSSTSRRRP